MQLKMCFSFMAVATKKQQPQSIVNPDVYMDKSAWIARVHGMKILDQYAGPKFMLD